MRYLLAILGMSLLVSVTGCDTGEIGNSSDGRSDGSETVLAEGATTVTTNPEPQALGNVEVKKKGLLVAVILWEGEPSQLTVKLRHVASDLTTEASGGTPVVATIDVTNDTVAAGTSWELSVTNSDGPDTSITYKVAFLEQ